jgi:hypothetical protein
MFFATRLVFGGTERAGSRFHVFPARTRLRRYRGRRVPFSCIAHPDSFSTVPRASDPIFILYARTHFWQYRGRWIQFSCFTLPDSFSAVPSASGFVFMFYAPGLVFGGIEGARYRFHVLRAGTHFRRYRGCRVPFSCFALPDSFSAVPRASGHVFMFCAHGLVFGGIEGVGSRFLILRARTHFRRYRGRRVPFSCFVLPDSFSAVPRASGPNIMFCAPGLIFDGVECVGSRFHVLRAQTRVCRVPRA